MGSLCDGLGSARECSLERSRGIGSGIGMQLQGYRIQLQVQLQVLAVSLAVYIAESRVSLESLAVLRALTSFLLDSSRQLVIALAVSLYLYSLTHWPSDSLSGQHSHAAYLFSTLGTLGTSF